MWDAHIARCASSTCAEAAHAQKNGAAGRRRRSAHGCCALDSARGIFIRPSTRGSEGRQQAAWRMPHRSWGGYLRSRLTPYLPLRCAGPPAAVRLRRHTRKTLRKQAHFCGAAATRRIVGQAGRPAHEPPLRAPHHILCQGVHPWGREEESEAQGVFCIGR